MRATHEIEDLLKTATEDQLNILKESLGNWADVKRLAESSNPNSAQKLSAQKGFAQNQSDAQKNQNTIQDDEDYIEEDFEEDNSDSPIEDATGADEGDDEEEQRLEQERLEQMRKASTRIQSTRAANKPTRPISATYSLAPHLSRPAQSSSTSNLGYQGGPAKRAETFHKDAVLSALEEENRKAVQSKRPAASARHFQGAGFVSSLPPKDSTGHLESIAGNMKSGKIPPKNPFGHSRPISQMLPKRPTEQQKSKTLNHPSLPKVADHQNYMQGPRKNAVGPNNTIDESNNETMEHDNTFSRHELDGSRLRASDLKDSSLKRAAHKDTVTISELLG